MCGALCFDTSPLKFKKKEAKMKKKDTTFDLPNPPKKRGGARVGAGRKKQINTVVTRSTRIDIRLTGILAILRDRLKSGEINDNDLKKFEEAAALF